MRFGGDKMMKMATLLHVGFFLSSFFLLSHAQVWNLPNELRDYTLCALGGPGRQCVRGSVCPSGSVPVRPRNYLMCMGPGNICCEQTASDECQTGTANCDVNADCADTSTSFTCTCRTGYSGDGFTCTDVNECTALRSPCQFGQTCYNTVGSFVCCQRGQEETNGFCRDINECSRSRPCATGQTCFNTVGSFVCCSASQQYINGQCRDRNECLDGTANCDINASCQNLDPLFRCTCNPGYTGNGFTCTESQSINDPECGELSPQARLAFGEDELECQSPWQVSLRRSLVPTSPPSIVNSIHVAGGVLVRRDWVLTTPLAVLFAGRSIPQEAIRENMFVTVGDFDHRDASGSEQLRSVRNVFFHPNASFNVNADFSNVYINSQESEWQANAFALLQLESPVNLTPCVKPACMPTGTCGSREVCKATGWGADENEQLNDILQKADVSVLEGQACTLLSGSTSLPDKVGCAINSRGSFACVGDFGGPVVCEGATPTAKRTVEGLAVTRLDCNNSNAPMRIALVCDAMDWIRSTIRQFL